MSARIATLVVLAGLLALLTGCGGNDGSAGTTNAPTAVTAADLDRDGTYWLTLTPDLKDELVSLGKTRLSAERPDGAAGIRAIPTDDLVAEIEKQYTNVSKRSATIYTTYVGANDTLAKAGLDDALNRLGQLCDSTPRPPQCDQSSP
jgi:hypothetical protein